MHGICFVVFENIRVILFSSWVSMAILLFWSTGICLAELRRWLSTIPLWPTQLSKFGLPVLSLSGWQTPKKKILIPLLLLSVLFVGCPRLMEGKNLTVIRVKLKQWQKVLSQSPLYSNACVALALFCWPSNGGILTEYFQTILSLPYR